MNPNIRILVGMKKNPDLTKRLADQFGITPNQLRQAILADGHRQMRDGKD